ncbi:MAG: transcription antitermination factor NusB [Culicoidibacterales bacterium]
MRIQSREQAVFLLYQIDLLLNQKKEKFMEMAEEEITRIEENDVLDKTYIEQLVLGTVHHIETIDLMIEKQLSKKWTLKRLMFIDRAILRAGVYELVFMNVQTKAPVINAYIELAKKFSDDDQDKFVNAILDKVE